MGKKRLFLRYILIKPDFKKVSLNFRKNVVKKWRKMNGMQVNDLHLHTNISAILEKIAYFDLHISTWIYFNPFAIW